MDARLTLASEPDQEIDCDLFGGGRPALEPGDVAPRIAARRLKGVRPLGVDQQRKVEPGEDRQRLAKV